MDLQAKITELEDEGHVSKDMLNSPAYRSLSPEAKVLLLLMYRKKNRRKHISYLVDLEKERKR